MSTSRETRRSCRLLGFVARCRTPVYVRYTRGGLLRFVSLSRRKARVGRQRAPGSAPAARSERRKENRLHGILRGAYLAEEAVFMRHESRTDTCECLETGT